MENLSPYTKEIIINHIYNKYSKMVYEKEKDYKLLNIFRVIIILGVLSATILLLSSFITMKLNYLFLILTLVFALGIIVLACKINKYSDKIFNAKKDVIRILLKEEDKEKIYQVLSLNKDFNLFTYLNKYIVKLVSFLTIVLGVLAPILKSISEPVIEKIKTDISVLTKFNWYQLFTIFSPLLFGILIIILGTLLFALAIILLIDSYNLLLRILKLTTSSKSSELLKMYILTYDITES